MWFELNINFLYCSNINVINNDFVEYSFPFEFIEDEYGFLADQEIDLLEFKEFSISKSEFEDQWKL